MNTTRTKGIPNILHACFKTLSDNFSASDPLTINGFLFYPVRVLQHPGNAAYDYLNKDQLHPHLQDILINNMRTCN
jgi:hypothetical protein